LRYAPDLDETPQVVLDLFAAAATKDRPADGSITTHEVSWMHGQLSAQLDKVAQHGRRGGFRHALLGAAMVAGRLVDAGQLTEQDATGRLRQAVRDTWGTVDDEDEQWIQDGLRDGPARERWRDEMFGLTLPTPQQLPTEDEEPPAPDDLGVDVAELYPELDWRKAWAGAKEEPDWLVAPVIERGKLYAVYSRAGAGKTLLVQEWTAALATGRSALGGRVHAPMDVMYVDMENDPSDLVERMSAFGYRPEQLSNLHYLSFPSLPVLDSAQGGLHLLAAALHYQAQVVVIDTVSRVVAGGENDSDTFHNLYRCALAPLKARGITVIRLDHEGKDTDRGQRGSSAKDSDVDVAWKIIQVTDRALNLVRGKHRNNHNPERVEIERRFSPLRHELRSEIGLHPAAEDLVTHLDRLGLADDASRPDCREKLKAEGVKCSTNDLAQAIRHRKQRAEPSPRWSSSAVRDSSHTNDHPEWAGRLPVKPDSTPATSTDSSRTERTTEQQPLPGQLATTKGGQVSADPTRRESA